MANYDVLESTSSYHGTEIRTKVPSNEYKDNFDAIFRKNTDSEQSLTEEAYNETNTDQTDSGS